MQVSARGIAIEVDDRGPPSGDPLLMIMGLGMQLTAWPDALVQQAGVARLSCHSHRQPRRRPEPGLRCGGRAQPAVGRVAPCRAPAGGQPLSAERHGRRCAGRARRIEPAAGARVRRVDGRHDRAASGQRTSAAREEPDADDDELRRARPAARQRTGAAGVAVAAARPRRRGGGRAPAAHPRADRQPGVSRRPGAHPRATAGQRAARLPAGGHGAPIAGHRRRW